MSKQLSIRLDDAVHRELSAAARLRGVGLATYLRELAAGEARSVRVARIRAESRHVGEAYTANAEARAFYDVTGLPDPEVLLDR